MFQDKLSTNERYVLSRALRYMDVQGFISELYEYIEINLKTSNPEVDSYDPRRLVRLFKSLCTTRTRSPSLIPEGPGYYNRRLAAFHIVLSVLSTSCH